MKSDYLQCSPYITGGRYILRDRYYNCDFITRTFFITYFDLSSSSSLSYYYVQFRGGKKSRLQSFLLQYHNKFTVSSAHFRVQQISRTCRLLYNLLHVIKSFPSTSILLLVNMSYRLPIYINVIVYSSHRSVLYNSIVSTKCSIILFAAI